MAIMLKDSAFSVAALNEYPVGNINGSAASISCERIAEKAGVVAAGVVATTGISLNKK